MKKNHKLINKTSILTLISIMFFGCQDLIEVKPIGQQTLDVTFKDFAGALAATNGIYATLTSSNLYRGANGLINIDQASDDVMFNPAAGGNTNFLDYFTINPTDAIWSNIWGDLYTVVYRSNVVINRVPNLTIPSAFANNSAGLPFKDQLIGEAKFLRAFAYFHLVRLYGDVPLRVEEIGSIEEINIPRSPTNEIFKQIEADLNDAIAKLPARNSGAANGNEKGRVVRWSAYALLTDVLLTQKKFADAKDAADKCITGALTNGYKLNDTYAANFAGRGGTENSPESLFEIQFGGATTSVIGPNGNTYAQFMSGSENTLPGTGTGVANYRPTDIYIENEPGFTGGLVQEYEAGDLRPTVNFYRGRGDGSNIRTLFQKQYSFGTSTGNENYPVYRLADVYLMYAEATNESSGPDNKSIEYINVLRRRAFGLPLNTPSINVDLSSSQTQSTFRNIVRSERRKELAGESKRWFDMLRYGFDYMQDVLVNKQKRTRFVREFMIFPLPATELIANPLLTQNKGY